MVFIIVGKGAGTAQFAGKPERGAEQKRDQDAGERLTVDGIDAEFLVQEIRRGGLDGAREKEDGNGVIRDGIRFDGFFGHGERSRRGHVERVDGGALEVEAGRQQDESQDCQETFHNNASFLVFWIMN
jgi:hypothetical protein